MNKDDKLFDANVNRREAWLIWQALEKELTIYRDERSWDYALEIMKLADIYKRIWQDNL